VIFHHGFVLPTNFYSTLLHHLASWGFVVVAPALYNTMGGSPFGHIDPKEEILRARDVLAWSQGSSLNQTLQGNPETSNVSADPQRVVVVGHSRGGKVAAALALPVDTVLSPSKDETCSDGAQECLVTSPFPLKGVALLDPVDGKAPPGKCCNNGCILDPRLTERRSLDFNMPTLVLGTGFGPQKWGCPLCICPCAPRGLGYEKFYKLAQTNGSGKFLFIAEDYGHLDILDKGKNNAATLACKAGNNREPLRQFSGGLLVAFLQAKVNQNQTFVKVFEELLKAPENTTVNNIKRVTAECCQAAELSCVDQ
jgi:chlorophyllase